MFFMNYKLFAIARSRRNNRISPETKMTFSLKNISSCLLAVVCFVLLRIPVFVYIGLTTTMSEKKLNLDNVFVAGLWASTITSMNSTFNCLIFYWKNKILRTEGVTSYDRFLFQKNCHCVLNFLVTFLKFGTCNDN
jgi:hypothetical protein